MVIFEELISINTTVKHFYKGEKMLTEAVNNPKQRTGIGEKLNSEFFDRAKQHLTQAHFLMKNMTQAEIRELEMFVANSLTVKK